MSGKWDPADFKDEFRRQVMQLVEKKAKAGDSHTVVEPEEEAPHSAQVLDLTALLQRSLRGAKAPTKTPDKSPAKARAKTTTKAPAKAAARKSGAATARKKAA